MSSRTTFKFLAALLVITIAACKKDYQRPMPEQAINNPQKVLNQREKEIAAKFEHAALVLQGLFPLTPLFVKSLMVL
ncbi:MAG TPA: hypothetical protein PKD90_01070 [Phnomibacter sp.]|nr:hypothetical protein [Phnomibacter sp.]